MPIPTFPFASMMKAVLVAEAVEVAVVEVAVSQPTVGDDDADNAPVPLP